MLSSKYIISKLLEELSFSDKIFITVTDFYTDGRFIFIPTYVDNIETKNLTVERMLDISAQVQHISDKEYWERIWYFVDTWLSILEPFDHITAFYEVNKIKEKLQLFLVYYKEKRLQRFESNTDCPYTFLVDEVLQHFKHDPIPFFRHTPSFFSDLRRLVNHRLDFVERVMGKLTKEMAPQQLSELLKSQQSIKEENESGNVKKTKKFPTQIALALLLHLNGDGCYKEICERLSLQYEFKDPKGISNAYSGLKDHTLDLRNDQEKIAKNRIKMLNRLMLIPELKDNGKEKAKAEIKRIEKWLKNRFNSDN